MAYEWINEKTGQPLNKKRMVDGKLVDLTAEEIASIEAEREASIEENKTAKENEETRKTNKVSGYRKNGLTDDEILAIDPTLEEHL